MAIQKINLGTEPHGVGGDSYRTANEKINSNFEEVGKDINDVNDNNLDTLDKLSEEVLRAKAAESDLNANIIKEVSDRELEVVRLDEADAVLQAQINSVGGGKLAYKTYAEMIADKSNIAAKSSIDILADTDDKNGTYLYDGTNFVKSNYDLEKLIRAKVQNAFGTYAQMVASNLSDGAYALVADDADDKNGIYIKEGGEWVKSKYDPEAYLQAALDKELRPIIKNNQSRDLLNIIDANGNDIVSVGNNGAIYINGVPRTSIQTLLNDYRGLRQNTIKHVNSGMSFVLLDNASQPLLTIDKRGEINIQGLNESVQAALKKSVVAKENKVYDKVSRAGYFPPYTSKMLNLMTDLAVTHQRIAPMPLYSGAQDVQTGTNWINNVKIDMANVRDDVIGGFDDSYKEDIQVVHPYVCSFKEQVLGYKHWLTITPYTNTNTKFEIPFLYGTNNDDLTGWKLIEGVPQPFAEDPKPMQGAFKGHLSDPAMIYDVYTGNMILFWRETQLFNRTGVEGYDDAWEFLKARKFDGVAWSEPYILMDAIKGLDDRILSPTIVHNDSNGLYYMYFGHTDGRIQYMTADNLVEPTWSPIKTCTFEGKSATGAQCWHLESRIVGDKVVLLINQINGKNYPALPALPSDRLMLAISSDFENFKLADSHIHNTSEKLSLYKASMMPHINKDGTAKITFIYSTHQDWDFKVATSNQFNLGA